MGLFGIKVTFISKNHDSEEFKKNQYDMICYYLGEKDKFIFILDESMNFMVLAKDDVTIESSGGIYYGMENEHTKKSVEVYARLVKYFDSFKLLKSMITFDIDKEHNVNTEYVKSHIAYAKKEFNDIMDSNV